MRFFNILYRDVWKRRIPSGLLSLRYLWTNDSRIRIHRAIWWQKKVGWRKIYHVITEMLLWLKWVGFFGWQAIFRALGAHGERVQQALGISRFTQLRRLVGLSIGNCIPPHQAYSFGLIKAPELRWDFVYDHEVQAYHNWRNQALGITRQSLELMGDKVELTKSLDALGVPMAPILACVPKNSGADLLEWLDDHDKLFCKSRSGNRGLGAFFCQRNKAGVSGRKFEGTILPDEASIEDAWQGLLKLDDALVQPALRNHPNLVSLAPNEQVITIRYISERAGEEIRCLGAVLEVPVDTDDEDKKSGYVILPINPKNGEILSFPKNKMASPEAQIRHDELIEKLRPGQKISDWRELVSASHRAHKQFPGLWAIAWDWVPSDKGLVLLEGNVGWGTAMPQLLHGGFIRGLRPYPDNQADA